MTKLDLLKKSSWTTNDIKAYLGCGRDTATNIRNLARQKGGSIPYLKYEVSVETVLKLIGTTRLKEIEFLKVLEKGEMEDEN
ncbi:MAG: hypothetical protein WC275_01975 [Bacilli bacterium]